MSTSVCVDVLTPSLHGVFGYTVEVTKPSHAPNEPWTTELERFVGPVIDWHALQDKANNRARFYAEAFGVTLFIADRDHVAERIHR